VSDILIGCSGWNYADWRRPVYDGAPQREWLELYAERFPTVEVNTTFYRLPRRSMVEGWAARTPAGFSFAVKVSRYLTHIKRLSGTREGMARLMGRIDPLAESGKLGPLLWQLPATFERDDARLAEALDAAPAEHRHCFEFRHASWFCPEVLAILRDAGAALVIGDDPGRPFQTLDRPAGWTYVRFHRGRRGRRGNYSPSEIDDWAARIRSWAQDGDVYAYYNNDWEAFAVGNAVRLASLTTRTRRSGRPA
jgi:uncharacterized protein YecE (DUF72 family)